MRMRQERLVPLRWQPLLQKWYGRLSRQKKSRYYSSWSYFVSRYLRHLGRLPCRRWCATHSQHFPWRAHTFVQGQSIAGLCSHTGLMFSFSNSISISLSYGLNHSFFHHLKFSFWCGMNKHTNGKGSYKRWKNGRKGRKKLGFCPQSTWNEWKKQKNRAHSCKRISPM